MKFDSPIHRRRSLRLKEYDYSRLGAYFITICTQNRECLLGKISNGMMHLNSAGDMIQQSLLNLPQRFLQIEIDEYIVMPNHLHGIIVIIDNPVEASTTDAPNPKSVKLGDIIGAFKSITTHQYIQSVHHQNWQPFSGKLWQRNYYEHIIRDDESLTKIRQYIFDNPLRWEDDEDNPKNIKKNQKM